MRRTGGQEGRPGLFAKQVRLLGVWQIWINNAKAKGILLAKTGPLDIRLHVDSRFTGHSGHGPNFLWRTLLSQMVPSNLSAPEWSHGSFDIK